MERFSVVLLGSEPDPRASYIITEITSPSLPTNSSLESPKARSVTIPNDCTLRRKTRKKLILSLTLHNIRDNTLQDNSSSFADFSTVRISNLFILWEGLPSGKMNRAQLKQKTFPTLTLFVASGLLLLLIQQNKTGKQNRLIFTSHIKSTKNTQKVQQNVLHNNKTFLLCETSYSRCFKQIHFLR